MIRRVVACSLPAFSLVFGGSVAFAAEPAPAPAPAPTSSVSPDQRARAQELFEKALADAQKGDFAAACPKFRASQEVDPKTSTLLNLGNCYEQNKQLASAWGAFKEASVRANAASRADWAKMADAHIAELEPKLAHISVLVPKEADAPGLVVMRDGVKILTGERGVPIPVDAGEHELSATAEGKLPWSTKVQIVDAQDAKLTVPILQDAPKPPPPPVPITQPVPGTDTGPKPEAPPPPYWSTWRIVGVGTAGAGVVTLGIGTAVGLVAKSNYDSAKKVCTDHGGPCPAGSDSVKRANDAISTANVATGVFVGGAVLAGAGAALFFLAPRLEGKTGQLQVAPSVVGMQGLTARGSF